MSDAISRRQFLRGALVTVTGALAASVPLAACAPPDYPALPRTLAFLSPKEYHVLAAAARRLLPGAENRLGADDVDVAARADALLAQADARLQADFKKLLGTLEDQPYLALRFQRFTAMHPDAQHAYLGAWATSPLSPMRQGFLALNKLSALMFYADPRTWKQIGYAGPWIGRFDFGLGLDNQGPLPANPNPNVYARHGA